MNCVCESIGYIHLSGSNPSKWRKSSGMICSRKPECRLLYVYIYSWTKFIVPVRLLPRDGLMPPNRIGGFFFCCSLHLHNFHANRSHCLFAHTNIHIVYIYAYIYIIYIKSEYVQLCEKKNEKRIDSIFMRVHISIVAFFFFFFLSLPASSSFYLLLLLLREHRKKLKVSPRIALRMQSADKANQQQWKMIRTPLFRGSEERVKNVK